MMGPIPGAVIRRWQAGSFSERLRLSADRASRRSSRRRQSFSSSAMRRRMRDERVSGGELKTGGRTLRKGSWTLAHGDAALHAEAPDLIDDSGALANKT